MLNMLITWLVALASIALVLHGLWGACLRNIVPIVNQPLTQRRRLLAAASQLVAYLMVLSMGMLNGADTVRTLDHELHLDDGLVQALIWLVIIGLVAGLASPLLAGLEFVAIWLRPSDLDRILPKRLCYLPTEGRQQVSSRYVLAEVVRDPSGRLELIQHPIF